MSDPVPPVLSQSSCVTIDSMHPIATIGEVLHHFGWFSWLILVAIPFVYVGGVILKKATQDASKAASDKLASFFESIVASIVNRFTRRSSSPTADRDTTVVTPISWLSAFFCSYLIYALCTVMIWDVQSSVQVAVGAYAAIPIMTFAVRALQKKWFARIFSRTGFLEQFLFVDIVFLFLCLFMMLSLLISRYLFLYPISFVLNFLHQL